MLLTVKEDNIIGSFYLWYLLCVLNMIITFSVILKPLTGNTL